MGFRQDVGRLLHIGGIIGGLGNADEQRPVIRALEAGEIGGVYLGYPHFRDPDHARRMVCNLQARAPYPIFVAADFEAGPGYNCAEGCAHFPYFGGIGFIDDPAVTRRVAEVTARQALAMGINWLYSPCVDVNLCPDNPIIGIRAFGEDTELVCRMGRAFVEGCNNVGVVSSGKHFPSTGNTRADTHIGFAEDMGDRATWEAKSLPPFVAVIGAGVPSLMTGHAVMPFLDPGVPATFSRVILHDILRDTLGYQGIVISDSLGMGGASVGDSIGGRCVRAFKAGNDVLLTPYCETIFEAFEGALRSDPALPRQLDVSLQRVERERERISRLPTAAIREEDQSFALDVGMRAARVLKDDGTLPLRAGRIACLTQWRNQETEYFPREPGVLSRFQHEVRCFDPSAPVKALSRECPTSEHAGVLRAVGDRPDAVLVAIVKNYAGDPYGGGLSLGTRELVKSLSAAGKRVVLVVLGSPYACREAPQAQAVICTGGDTIGCVLGALAEVLGKAA